MAWFCVLVRSFLLLLRSARCFAQKVWMPFFQNNILDMDHSILKIRGVGKIVHVCLICSKGLKQFTSIQWQIALFYNRCNTWIWKWLCLAHLWILTKDSNSMCVSWLIEHFWVTTGEGRIKTTNIFFSSFLFSSIPGWTIPRGPSLKGSPHISQYNGNLSIKIFFTVNQALYHLPEKSPVACAIT